MADPTIVDPIPNLTQTDFDGLSIPPLDPSFTLSDNFISFDDDDVQDFDFTFDDLYLPSDTDEFLNPPLNSSDPESDCLNQPQISHSHVSDCGSTDVAAFLNSPSPSSQESESNKSSDVPKISNSDSPIHGPVSSQGSENKSIKLEGLGKDCILKRKKETEDVNSELRTSKYRRSIVVEVADESCGGFSAGNDDDEKRKARLMRNRESAQLSRQRKKHYVEELEDKVRSMHSTIQDLNAKISYIVAENASLRQQFSGGGVCPPPMPPPGMYPMPPMGYPWMPCPPYVVKPQGSQVPLVPIPRLKPQQPVKSKKVETKKTEGKSKTKKVASVSFLGLLFFILLFGGLVPMVNVKYGGMSGSDYIDNRFYDQRHGSVLTVNGTNPNIGIGVSHCGTDHGGGAQSGNASEPLLASLYVPRNDKLVKIDGNLIIHSVLASEKARASHEDREMKSSEETGLAVALDLAPAIPVPGVVRNGKHPRLYRTTTERQRALASGSADKENQKSTAADGKMQQWFLEGLAGPLLSSGVCTEVFQFEVASAPGAIISVPTSVTNSSTEERQNSTHLNKVRNRRILPGLPIPLPGTTAHNITNKRVGSNNSQKENSHTNSSLSSMIVSVLVDPREAGDGNVDGMMGPKSLSRIFVVVLLDSVKYVTYSCVLPLMGSSSHLVTT